MRIINANHGIAYAYDNVIEVNPLLKQYPKLYKETIEHEKKHLKSNKAMDFTHDLFDGAKVSKEWLRFTFNHPKAFMESLAPVWIDRGQICFNLFLITLYSIIGLIIYMVTRLI